MSDRDKREDVELSGYAVREICIVALIALMALWYAAVTVFDALSRL